MGAYPSRIHHRRTPTSAAILSSRRLALCWSKTRFAYEGLPLRNELDEQKSAEFPHADSRLSRRRARIARAVGAVPQGRQTGLP
jgi:hypothetical protein